MHAAALVILTGLLPGQVTALPTATELITRFRALQPGQRSDVMRQLDHRFARENYDLLQRIEGSQKGKAAYALPAMATWFEPRDFAPGATARGVVGIGSAAHQAATRGMQPFVFLPDLNRAVVYDWGQGAAVHLGVELDEVERFANVAHGFAPGADHMIAQVLAALDTDPRQRRLGAYFEHLYADRVGNVFAKISLYDAWRSGRQLEMPDTDVIAFAQQVLETRSFSAPLAANRRRERLYGKIRDGFADHRDHRTLRLALAATCVTASPELEPGYEGLVDRAHWLWLHVGEDVTKLAAMLQAEPERDELFRRIDQALPGDFEAVTRRKQGLVQLANYLQSCADEELRRVGG